MGQDISTEMANAASFNSAMGMIQRFAGPCSYWVMTYDGSNNLLTVTGYDNDQNMTSRGIVTFTYDASNNPITAKLS